MTTTPAERPKVLELVVRANPDKVLLWACGTCTRVCLDEDAARTCCAYQTCGVAVGSGYECRTCADKRMNEPRASHDAVMERCLAEATQVPEAEYGGEWVSWDDRGPGRGYFASLDELREYCLRDGVEPPERVWACMEIGLEFDAKTIIDEALNQDGHHEGAGDSIDRDAEAALQQALDAWCAEYAGGVVLYFPDYTRAVVLDPAAWKGST